MKIGDLVKYSKENNWRNATSLTEIGILLSVNSLPHIVVIFSNSKINIVWRQFVEVMIE
tara:strand:- start:1103 stop:1279 length:177 start_codon:yes stop_codon:yes gene_type:complete